MKDSKNAEQLKCRTAKMQNSNNAGSVRTVDQAGE